MAAEIHNDVGKVRLALKPGDGVSYERDDGTFVYRTVKHPPDLMGGVFVVWLHGERGCVALCRCHPGPMWDSASFEGLPRHVPRPVAISGRDAPDAGGED